MKIFLSMAAMNGKVCSLNKKPNSGAAEAWDPISGRAGRSAPGAATSRKRSGPAVQGPPLKRGFRGFWSLWRACEFLRGDEPAPGNA